MASAAVVGGRWMFSRFTRRGNAIVTTYAVRPDVGVTERRWRPCAGAVAGIALCRGRQMGRRLTLRGDTVVTTGTGARRNAVVVENRA